MSFIASQQRHGMEDEKVNTVIPSLKLKLGRREKYVCTKEFSKPKI